MKVNIALSELSKKMNAISGVVPVKTTMPILSTVLVSADGAGLNISATDLDISATSKVKGDVGEKGSIAVPAKKLAEIVKSLTSGSVRMEAEENKLTLSCGKSRFVINGRSPEDFPRIPKQDSKVTFMINPAALGALVQKTAYAVSTDLTRPALCGVLWEIAPGRIAMVSTDGHRLARVEETMELEGAEKMEVIVPPKALTLLRSYTEGVEEVKVGVGENSIRFEMEESTIYSRLFEGPFPSYERVIPAGNKKELVVSRSALAEATKRVAILSDALTHQVILSIEKDKVTLNVNTQELGEAREEIEASFSDEPMDVAYNAGYILDILKTIESDDIAVLLDKPDNAGLVKPVEQSEKMEQICIIMPLRIS